MNNALLNTGTILVKTLNQVALNRLVIQDTDYLNKLLTGALSAPEVVYGVIRDQNGKILASQSKGVLVRTSTISRDSSQPLLPDETPTQHMFSQPPLPTDLSAPLITLLQTSNSGNSVSLHLAKHGASSSSLAINQEHIYDFALPVYRSQLRSTTLDLLFFETLEKSQTGPELQSGIIGLIQVGISTAHMKKTLNQTVRDIGLLTFVIILIGIALTILLTNRIIHPIQKLAKAAHHIAEGDLAVNVAAETYDEVGQLTHSINQMTQGLQQREVAITTYLETITKQVAQLSTLHQTGAVITSTLDVQKLFSTVLRLLRENLGFQRMVLALREPSNDKGVISEISGIPDELVAQMRGFEFAIIPGTFDEKLLLQGQPVHVPDLSAAVDQMNPDILALGRQVELISFVAAPLISHKEIIGYLGADKGQIRCTQEDLNLLVTIANYVAVAIDNARTYQDMETLAQGLEKRVADRTKDLREANDRLQELDRLKSAFVSIVSHELRTPMTSIKGLIENMMDGLTGQLNERQTFYLDRVNHNIERLTRMINDLLDLSRIEAGRMELHSTSVNMGSIAREVVELLKPMAEEQSLKLTTKIIDPISFIQADRDKLIQILTNLITNAIKFTGPSGTVIVHVQEENEEFVTTCIQDDGCGIPQDEQPTIFERFYRGQTGDVKSRGAGLGLAITKSLVELHGGTIWVTSTVGEGSQFFVRLPSTTDPIRTESRL